MSAFSSVKGFRAISSKRRHLSSGEELLDTAVKDGKSWFMTEAAIVRLGEGGGGGGEGRGCSNNFIIRKHAEHVQEIKIQCSVLAVQLFLFLFVNKSKFAHIDTSQHGGGHTERFVAISYVFS